jgi:hypothetical protein
MKTFSYAIEGNSLDFLKEKHTLIYLGIRGYGNLIDEAGKTASNFAHANVNFDMIPGVLEAALDWKRYRSSESNPFARLSKDACQLISKAVHMNLDRSRVYLFDKDDTANMAFNLRTGLALAAYGEDRGEDDWASLGRSIVLSVLSMDSNGSVPGVLIMANNGSLETAEKAGGLAVPSLSAGRIYQMMGLGDYRARALSLGEASGGLWAWTAASDLSCAASIDASTGRRKLDISVSFPAGETHYMMIRNVPPFSQIMLYDIPWPTDPEFDRYDSSGWIYSAKEKTLMLKMKHKAAVEHIVITFHAPDPSARRIVPPPRTKSPS